MAGGILVAVNILLYYRRSRQLGYMSTRRNVGALSTIPSTQTPVTMSLSATESCLDNTTSSPPTTLEPWLFAADTTQIPEEEYIDVEVLDISTFRGLNKDICLSEPEVAAQQELVTRAVTALREVGFIALTGHGLKIEDTHYQFGLGKLCFDDVQEDEKHRLHAKITQDAIWAGYKPQKYYGYADTIEYFDIYPFSAVKERLPDVAKPYLHDFRQFIEFNHYEVLRKLLAIISLGLGMPINTLWDLHHRGSIVKDGALQGDLDKDVKWQHSHDHLRYAMYYPPREKDRRRRRGLWLPGHTDRGSVTFLYSQPIAGLQVYSPDGEWRYVRHYPGAILVNMGDCMEFVTGGVLKGVKHRVAEPPDDQRLLRRQGIFYFATLLPDAPVALLDYPSLQEMGGKDLLEEYYLLGGSPITCDEYMRKGVLLIGKERPKRPERTAEDVLEDIYYR